MKSRNMGSLFPVEALVVSPQMGSFARGSVERPPSQDDLTTAKPFEESLPDMSGVAPKDSPES